jgi:hypothetical protein
VVLSQAGVPRERHAASHSATAPALCRGTNSGYGIGRPAQRLTRDTACVSAAFFASWRIEIGVCENQRSSGYPNRATRIAHFKPAAPGGAGCHSPPGRDERPNMSKKMTS